MSEIKVIGNSFCLPSLEVPNPWTLQLELDVVAAKGCTIDWQAEQILIEKFPEKLVWIVGSRKRCDPQGNEDFLLPYKWKEDDRWKELDRKLWFDYFTSYYWLTRIAALSILAVTSARTPDNLLIVPLFKRSIVNSTLLYPAIKDYLWMEPMGELRKQYPDGSGHINQEGHDIYTKKVEEKLKDIKWSI